MSLLRCSFPALLTEKINELNCNLEAKFMKRKKFLHGMMILFILMICTGCTSLSSGNSRRWIERELPPSRIDLGGSEFMEVKLSGRTTAYVYRDDSIEEDSYFYYNFLMRDFGWRNTGGVWTGSSYTKTPAEGHIYINADRQIAIYFYPRNGFVVFKVRLDG